MDSTVQPEDRNVVVAVVVPLAAVFLTLGWWALAVPPWHPVGNIETCALRVPVRPEEAIRIAGSAVGLSIWELRWSRLDISVEAVLLDRLDTNKVVVYRADCATMTQTGSGLQEFVSIPATQFAWRVEFANSSRTWVYVDWSTGSVLRVSGIFELAIREPREFGTDVMLPLAVDAAVCVGAGIWWTWSWSRTHRPQSKS